MDRGSREGARGLGFWFLFLRKLPVALRRPDLSACSIPSRSQQRLLSRVRLWVNAVKPCVIAKVSLGANFSTLIDFYKFAEDPFESLKLW